MFTYVADINPSSYTQISRSLNWSGWNLLDMATGILWMLLPRIEESGKLTGGLVDEVPGSKKWDPPSGPTELGIPPAVGAPVTLRPLGLIVTAEGLEKAADCEITGEGFVLVGGIDRLDGPLEGREVLLGGCTALILAVLL
jgi:hypothetical protein